MTNCLKVSVKSEFKKGLSHTHRITISTLTHYIFTCLSSLRFLNNLVWIDYHLTVYTCLGKDEFYEQYWEYGVCQKLLCSGNTRLCLAL